MMEPKKKTIDLELEKLRGDLILDTKYSCIDCDSDLYRIVIYGDRKWRSAHPDRRSSGTTAFLGQK